MENKELTEYELLSILRFYFNELKEKHQEKLYLGYKIIASRWRITIKLDESKENANYIDDIISVTLDYASLSVEYNNSTVTDIKPFLIKIIKEVQKKTAELKAVFDKFYQI